MSWDIVNLPLHCSEFLSVENWSEILGDGKVIYAFPDFCIFFCLNFQSIFVMLNQIAGDAIHDELIDFYFVCLKVTINEWTNKDEQYQSRLKTWPTKKWGNK